MSELVLERFCYCDWGVFGELLVGDDGFGCFTVERPWLANRRRESCIPCGEYRMELGVFHKGGYAAWELLDVPGRSEIKIHVGNTSDDVEGCIAIGTALGCVHERWGVIGSRLAFQKFMQAMRGLESSQPRIEIRNRLVEDWAKEG